jgi:hypothetical protein
MTSTSSPLFWLIPVWAAVASIYYVTACSFLLRKTGVNIWETWRATTDNLKTERRFAVEIQRLPAWHIGYLAVKWGTLVIVIVYLAGIFVFLSRK